MAGSRGNPGHGAGGLARPPILIGNSAPGSARFAAIASSMIVVLEVMAITRAGGERRRASAGEVPPRRRSRESWLDASCAGLSRSEQYKGAPALFVKSGGGGA